MQTVTPHAIDLYESIDPSLMDDEYNFQHFRTKHLINDARRSIRRAGIQPGELAPDFDLPCVGGGTVRLSSLRGQPVLLHIGSYT